MKIALFTKDLESLSTEALAVGFFEGFDKQDVEKYNELSEGFMLDLVKDKELT